MQLEQKRFDAVEREQERLLEQENISLERLRLDLMAEGKYGNSKQPSSLASMVKFLPKFNVSLVIWSGLVSTKLYCYRLPYTGSPKKLMSLCPLPIGKIIGLLRMQC